ncbi:type VI secretion system-associated FHA domain protein TagH [Serratia silvae]|uniref:Type VI secretion system-associated FHA domain protein TagH n=1 Tax=Serratia silvae TaxID=2824122 RepID=A0ABT0KAU1_9GAMM|nr:type VI secretion system-associated FHA domain protein TagH [Serratia silvae]MCL1029159.1 type VI secretion system-associated FHA domain protein TagH [Serratia silvae]
MRFSIVKNKNGQVPPQNSCDFLPPGGTIGRSVDNNLVLPDEERAISRLQAIVHISAEGECRITNRGNVTSIQLNDIPLECGRQVELQDGDILGIDDYQIQVNSLQQSAAPTPIPAPASSVTCAIDVEPEPTVAPPAKQQNVETVPNEIWDSLIQEFTPQETAPVQATYNDNHHPLLEEPRVELNPSNPLEQLTNSIGLHHLQPRQTDPATLFNSDTTLSRDHILADTTPSALLAESSVVTHTPEPAPSTENNSDDQELDPLALFGAASSPVTPSVQNNNDPLGLMTSSAEPLTEVSVSSAPELPISTPQPILANAPKQQAIISSQAPEAPPLHQQIPESTPITEPQSPKAQAQVTPAPSLARSGNRLGIDPVAYSAVPPQNSVPASKSEMLEGPLLNALLQGLGLDDLQTQPQFDEQQLHQAGRLLSLFSQGTVALLSSRSIIKRNLHTQDTTMILDDANNPFKLLPSGKTVLMQMFGSKMPGFMPPEQSVRDALIDLQAHQLGMIAGIQALISAMLESFNPEYLEKKAHHEGVMPRLTLPTRRKAALWDYFIRNHQKTAAELEDDFHTMFGEAFLRAYGLEINQYKDSQTKPGDQ